MEFGNVSFLGEKAEHLEKTACRVVLEKKSHKYD